MRKGRFIIAFSALTAVLVFYVVTRGWSVARPGDVSAQFLGLIYDPNMARVEPWVAVINHGSGPYALFGVTNRSFNSRIWLGLQSIERQVGNVWEALPVPHSNDFWGGPWTPGNGCYFAYCWPEDVGTNTPWRLNLWTKREPSPISRWINQRVGRKVFQENHRSSSTSSVVMPNVFFELPRTHAPPP